MGHLTSLTLPIGSQASRLALTQDNVDTLIKVYYDDAITHKDVSGYVTKSTLKQREYYLLTQLGLDVSYTDLVEDTWSLSSSQSLLKDGQSAEFSVSGDLTIHDVVLSIDSCTVTLGTITVEQAMGMVTLTGNMLSYSRNTSYGNYSAEFTIKATPAWGGSAKTVTVGIISQPYHSVWINPITSSATLEREGDMDLIEDYISRCKCYLFSSDGTKKAEIGSATFQGAYVGMSNGSVTLADGTQVAIQTLNSYGVNWMVLRPEMHIYCGFDARGEVLQNTGIYDMFGGKSFPKKYIGMFKAFNHNGYLKSQPNRIPTGGQTIQVFQNQATAGGLGYGLWNYSDWCKENALHLSYFGNTNYEYNVGTGRITNYNYVRNIVTGFTLPLVGQNICGRVSTVDSQGNSVNCLNFFGIEGLGEQIWEFVIGFRHDGTKAYVWERNIWSETQEADRTYPLQVLSANQQYVKEIIAGADFDMLPRSIGGTSTSGMCDGHWINSNGRLLLVGGSADSGSICGLSASSAIYAFSFSHAHLGARLAFYGEPGTVSGSEFVAGLN